MICEGLMKGRLSSMDAEIRGFRSESTFGEPRVKELARGGGQC